MQKGFSFAGSGKYGDINHTESIDSWKFRLNGLNSAHMVSNHQIQTLSHREHYVMCYDVQLYKMM